MTVNGVRLLTFRMNNPVMMTTEAFSQNVSKFFSELKLVTDNLPFSVMQEPTEKPLKNNDAIVPFISEPPDNGIVSTVQLVSYEIPQPLQSTWNS